MLIEAIKIDDIIYDESMVANMDSLQLKSLISFVDTERDLNYIKSWTKIESIQVYIDNLIAKCF